MATDIKMYWDSSALQGDFNTTENTGDIDTDEGLDTAILISLFTDRRINEDDPILDSNNDNKRGWWGDIVSNVEDDQIGSRLWLLDRSKAVDEVLVQCKEYALESLPWLIDDGIAKNINVIVERCKESTDNRLYFLVEITKNDGELISKKYEYLWYNQSISTPSYLPSRKYGPELVLNGDFFYWDGDEPKYWNRDYVSDNNTYVERYLSEYCRFVTTSLLYIPIYRYQNILTIGKTYQYVIHILSTSGDGVYCTNLHGDIYSSMLIIGVNKGIFTAITNTAFVISAGGTCDTIIKNISIKEVL